MAIVIGEIKKVDAASAVDHDVIHRLRRALHAAGIEDADHQKIIVDACHAEALIPHSYGGSSFHAAASSTDDQKKARIDKLNAAKADPAHRSNIEMLEGLLRRGDVTLDSVAGSDLAAIDKAFASSKLTLGDKIAAKAILHRYRAI